MEKFYEFISQHQNDDISRLILDRKKWPEIDIDLAVNCIESRRKLKGKVQEWYDNQRLIFPRKLSAEQCSSSETASYKASLLLRITGRPPKVADLTGGFGVDSWHFSKVAEQVLYNEMIEELASAAIHNFSELGADNISVSNTMICPEGTETDSLCNTSSIRTLLDGFCPDIVFLDPARRDSAGKKVFLLEDCQPDILGLKDEIFRQAPHILLKLSPMADITMAVSRLGSTCREVHIVSSGGECKELLIWMDREWDGEYSMTIYEKGNTLTFSPSEEKKSCSTIVEDPFTDAHWLFEPGKSLMKSGAFNYISQHFGISKLGRSTHYYIIGENHSEICRELQKYGKVVKIIRTEPLNNKSIKALSKEYPNAEVTARNLPLTSEQLAKKLGCQPGSAKKQSGTQLEVHIYGLKSDTAGNLLILTTCK